MKRVEQLHKLSMEHHGSLKMAKRMAKIAEEGSDADVIDAIEMVKFYNTNELEEHFQHEERTIFAPIFKEYKEQVSLATILLKEHEQVRSLIAGVTNETARENLAEFALILRNHTRIEERELFPVVQDLFTEEQLHKLSMEHHGSLKMAKRMAKIAEEGSDEDVIDAIEMVKFYNTNELEEHFQHEERTIFAPIFKEYKEHISLATILLKEHGQVRSLIASVTTETAREDLAEFALILKNHTRIEERELFPVVQDLFTEEQLDAVLNFKPL